MKTKALMILAIVKEAPRTTLTINTICNFETMKNAVELLLMLIYSTIIKILLICYVDIQESPHKDNAKFNFIGVIFDSKMSWRVHLQVFRELKN